MGEAHMDARIPKNATVALVAADPFSTDPDRLEEEADVIRRAAHDAMRVETIVERNREKLSSSLSDLRPSLVQFSAHGSASGQVLLANRRGEITHVAGRTLAQLIKPISPTPRAFILNGCTVSRDLSWVMASTPVAACIVGAAFEAATLPFSEAFFGKLVDDAPIYEALTAAVGEVANSLHLTHNTMQRRPAFFFDEEIAEGSRTGEAALPESDAQPKRRRYRRSPGAQKIARSRRSPGAQKRAKRHAQTARKPIKSPPPGAHLVRVWYGTNRKPRSETDHSKGFGGRTRPGSKSVLHLGTCEVIVPQSHKTGSVGSPRWQIWKKDRLRIYRRLPILESDFWTALAKAVSQDVGKPDILCFIHGYNVGFDEAAIRAAQIGHDLRFPGEVSFFSWPSAARMARYKADEAAVEASEADLATFLMGLSSRTGARQVHVLAHSMGNRALLRAVHNVVSEVSRQGTTDFTQIILAAPDVDAEAFRKLAAGFPDRSVRTTLYVCPRDQALRLSGSKFLSSYPRAGISPPVTIVDRVDTVEVEAEGLGLLSHSYYGSTWPVLGDIHSLLTSNSPPDSRLGIREASDQGGLKYWVLA